MKKIIVTGGSGFIGQNLIKELISKGYHVVCLDIKSPNIKSDKFVFHKIDLSSEKLDSDLIESSFAVVNLAGAPIFGRFTEKYKNIISNSRLKTTNNLCNAISLVKNKPSVLVSASAVGYYGDTDGSSQSEDMPHGRGFLAKLCFDWENSANSVLEYGVRVVNIRTAYVLGPGGIMGTLVPLFKKRIGGYFGNGKQIMSFVSVYDLVRIYLHAIENPNTNGPYNTAVLHSTQKDFMKMIAKHIKYSFVWRIPKIFGYVLYLSFVNSLTENVKLDSNKLIKSGFVFKDQDLESLVDKIYEENYR